MTWEATAARQADMLASPVPMMIDGQRILAASGASSELRNPATGEHLANAAAAGPDEVERAVQAARRSFENGAWLKRPAAERARLLFRIADLIDSASDELAQLEVLESGMPLPQAQRIVARGGEAFRYFGGWITKIHGLTVDVSVEGQTLHAYTLREPVGIAALIVPWNGPILFACQKVAAALAAGCSVILKPAEETPLTAVRLGEILHQAGVPAGVLNVVTGLGEIAGAALAAHPDVDKIAFTGSTEVGRLIAVAAAGNFKKVTLELGGKSPVVICADAEISSAIPSAALGIFSNAGQACIAGSRLYVHRTVYARVVEGVAKIAAALRLGNGFDSATQMGPLISARQLDRVLAMVERAKHDGAECVTGGRRWGERGYFMEPTVLAEPPAGSEILREEVFGPVLAIVPFDDIDEVTVLANETRYGLAAAVWTRDLSLAHRLARRLRAGTIWLNCQRVLDLAMPFGGYKQSGWGRENGWEGLEGFLQTKAVFAAL